jgi:signal transduction histidine kinase
MAWNKFNGIVLLQILGIAGVGMLVILSLKQEFLHMTSAGLIFLWVAQILFLNYYLNRIHRDVYKFMEALKNQDTAQLFNRQNQGGYFKKLYASFNDITRNFRLVRIEKEVENQFYRETIQQSASGLIALTADGAITLINGAASKLLDLEEARTLADIRKAHPPLAAVLEEASPEDHHLQLLVRDRLIQVAVKAWEMHLQGSPVRIVSLLDISRELAQNELEAWQKLIRVLNHEITNSLTPIHILSTSLLDLVTDGRESIAPDQVQKEQVDRLVLGLKTLSKRSQGLVDFLNTYNSFTDTSEPVYSTFRLDDLFKRLASLLEPELRKSDVELHMEISPPDLEILADEKLLEQSLINLVQNAIFATREVQQARIQLRASCPDKHVRIEVSDNGKGIPEEIRDHIFTPFFTTRKEGSGIGLSLAMQVMQMHNGLIYADSVEGEITTFTLTF